MVEQELEKEEIELKIIRKTDFIADNNISLNLKAEKILSLLLSHFSIRKGAIVCHDPFNNHLVSLAQRGEINNIIVNKCFRTRQIITVAEQIAYPIKIRNRIFGVVYLSGKVFDTKDQSDIGSVEIILDGTMESYDKTTNLSNLFEKYVDEKIIQRLIDHPDRAHIQGERHNCSILFADLNSFTSYSAKHRPEQVIKLLNMFYAEMSEIAFKWQGTVDKFIGDEVMIVFGTPIAQKDHAARAINCAVEMIKNSQKITDTFSLDEGGLCIGIATGRVIAGDVGSSKMKDYTVIGNKVNLASRLTSKSPTNEILVDDETRRDAKEFEYEIFDVGEIQGFGGENKIYRVIK